jgi:hypothetical protein
MCTRLWVENIVTVEPSPPAVPAELDELDSMCAIQYCPAGIEVANGICPILLPDTNATTFVRMLFPNVLAIVLAPVNVEAPVDVVLYVTPPEPSCCAGKLRVNALKSEQLLVAPLLLKPCDHDAKMEYRPVHTVSRRDVPAPVARR